MEERNAEKIPMFSEEVGTHRKEIERGNSHSLGFFTGGNSTPLIWETASRSGKYFNGCLKVGFRLEGGEEVFRNATWGLLPRMPKKIRNREFRPDPSFSLFLAFSRTIPQFPRKMTPFGNPPLSFLSFPFSDKEKTFPALHLLFYREWKTRGPEMQLL